MSELKTVRPVFILGSERSGTNLLRSLLSNHSGLHGPLSPHFIQEFGFSSRYYAPLGEKTNAYNLFRDMLALANHPYTDWRLELDFEQVRARYRPGSFFDYLTLFYHESALAAGKVRFVSKEINVWNYIFQILSYYEDVRFVYIYRDPRDYVASWVRKPLFIKTPYDAIKYWLYDQECAHALVNSQGVKMHPVKYEELIVNPTDVMQGVLDYIDVPVEAACFQTDRRAAEKTAWNPYWENLGRAINNSSVGNYRNVLDHSSLNMIETLAGHHMRELGYTPDTAMNWSRPRLMELRNRANRAMVQIRMRDHINSRMKLLHSKIKLIRACQAEAKYRHQELKNR